MTPNLSRADSWQVRQLDAYHRQIVYPSLKRLVQIKFGEPRWKHESCPDMQANTMISKLNWHENAPAVIFLKFIIAEMLLNYCITGAVDIRYNKLVQLLGGYSDDFLDNRPMPTRMNALLEYKEG